MRIDVKRVDVVPMSVDTPADLEKVRAVILAESAAKPRRIA
jgi:CMP-2-keto-3-deoxyoctulosonic acid synthetase